MKIERTIKMLNTAGNGCSWLQSIITGKPVIYGMPVAAGVELTSLCNLRCPECATGSGRLTRPAGFMDLQLFEKITAELKPFLYNLNLYFQGEPMLHPEFFRFIEIGSGIKMTVSTNGHFLSAENAEKIALSGLYKLIVSLDGMDQASYSVYRRNGEFEKVRQGITEASKAIIKTRSSLKLEIQFLVNRHNEDQIDRAREFARETGATLMLKSMQVINSDRIDEWMPGNESFKRYRKANGRYILKSRLSNRCLRLWINPVITWDGKVIPCCFDKDAEHVMGDLNRQSFKEIWHGENYRTFRESVLNGRKSIEICRNCTSGIGGVRY
jgi:radical SAM protein with 4Fe4S-binding SPASM domain